MSVYLNLFHGRSDPNEHMDDWGTTGPTFGPLLYVSGTYAADVKFEYEGAGGHARLVFDEGGLLFYDSVYYGDFAVSSHVDPDTKLTTFDEKLSWIPMTAEEKELARLQEDHPDEARLRGVG